MNIKIILSKVPQVPSRSGSYSQHRQKHPVTLTIHPTIGPVQTPETLLHFSRPVFLKREAAASKCPESFSLYHCRLQTQTLRTTGRTENGKYTKRREDRFPTLQNPSLGWYKCRILARWGTISQECSVATLLFFSCFIQSLAVEVLRDLPVFATIGHDS